MLTNPESWGEHLLPDATPYISDDVLKYLRDLVLWGLGMVPEIGGILSKIAGLFIPVPGKTPEQMWKEFVAQINELIDHKISEAVFNLVSQHLIGLTNLAKQYSDIVATGDKAEILRTSSSMISVFSALVPEFQTKDHELSLVPLFTQAAMLELSLYRDLVLKGKELGLGDAVVALYRTTLSNKISVYSDYVTRLVDTQLKKVAAANPQIGGFPRNQPLAAVLEAQAQYQLVALDAVNLWQYYDAQKYPAEVQARIDREVFSIMVGSYFDAKVPCPDRLPYVSPPQGEILNLQIRAYEFIDGFTLGYHGLGPGGAQEVVLGGMGGEKSNLGITPQTRITKVECGYSLAVTKVRFHDVRGHTSPWFGDRSGQTGLDYMEASFPDHMLSSIRGFGKAEGYGGVLSGAVFGFQLIDQTAKPPSAALIERVSHAASPRMLEQMLR